MIAWVSLMIGLREIRRNTMRTILTMLGIVIGVASVIAMVTLGQSTTAKVTNDISSMGSNMLTITPGSRQQGPVSSTGKSFSLADATAIARQVPYAARVAPAASRGVQIVNGNQNHSTVVHGTTEAFFHIRRLSAKEGRLFSAADVQSGKPVCVLGQTVRRELFASANPIGATLRVGGVSCHVIGLLQEKGKSSFGEDQDDLVVMPLTTFQRRVAGSTDVTTIYVSAKSEKDTTRAKRQIEALLRERRRIQPGAEDDFNVMDMKEIADTLSTVTAALTALLGAIAAVSLLVGGIGIMNIMLVSVTERTREIGIRLAVGARAHEVLLQFLLEAVVLSLLGGIIGMMLGVGASLVGTHLAGLPFVWSPTVVGWAVGFSGATGVIFGYVPARKAAQLNPIDALRHE